MCTQSDPCHSLRHLLTLSRTAPTMLPSSRRDAGAFTYNFCLGDKIWDKTNPRGMFEPHIHNVLVRAAFSDIVKGRGFMRSNDGVRPAGTHPARRICG